MIVIPDETRKFELFTQFKFKFHPSGGRVYGNPGFSYQGVEWKTLLIYQKGCRVDLYLGFEDESLLSEDYSLDLAFQFT
jgi:hypothetical protein